MRILILTQHYPPEPFPRPADLAKWLVGRGHHVVVITGFPYYPTCTFYPETKIRIWSREIVEGVSLLRLPLYPDHSRSPLRRTLNYGSFSLSTAILGTLLSGTVDAVFVEHPSTFFGLSACLVSGFRRVPFVYMVDDVWPDSVQASGMLRHQGIIAGIERMEQFVYKRAGAIAVISQGNRDRLVAKGVPERKVHFVPHYANEEIYEPVSPDPTLREKLGINGRFTIVFAGHVGMAQGLDVVLSAAQMLVDLPDVIFLIVGEGSDKSRLQELARKKRLNNVQFLDRRPAEEMRYLFSVADGLLVHLRDEPTFRLTIPSKTMAYMACERPIIMAVAGDAAELIRSTGAGLTCSPENPKELANTVRKLWSMSPDARAAMGWAGRQRFLGCHTRTAVLKKYETLLVEVQEV